MFILPITGDTVETNTGAQHTVLSYAPYKDEPAVFVDTGANTVKLSEIEKINGTPVSLNGGKIFVANSKIARKFQLPQVNDKVLVDGDTPQTIKVKSIKLFERNNLASGVQIAGVNIDTKASVTARLIDVMKIERADGTDDFTRGGFRKVYKDYLGST